MPGEDAASLRRCKEEEEDSRRHESKRGGEREDACDLAEGTNPSKLKLTTKISYTLGLQALTCKPATPQTGGGKRRPTPPSTPNPPLPTR